MRQIKATFARPIGAFSGPLAGAWASVSAAPYVLLTVCMICESLRAEVVMIYLLCPRTRARAALETRGFGRARCAVNKTRRRVPAVTSVRNAVI